MKVIFKNLFPTPIHRETAWDRFRRFNAQKDEPMIDLSELEKVLEDVFARHEFNRMSKMLDDEEIARTVPHGYIRIPDVCASKPTVVQLNPGEGIMVDKNPPPVSVPNTSTDDSTKKPPSIFDQSSFRKIFGDVVGNKAFNEIFGIEENEHEQEEEEDEEDSSVKDPYVFIANRLTFLIQTKLPIIFDTSIIETGLHAKVNYMSIAVNVDKTFPKIETENDLAFIMREFNGSKEIQGEINEFLKDTEYDGIWAFPSTIVRNDVKIPAVRFVIYPKRKYYNFGPAFVNRNK